MSIACSVRVAPSRWFKSMFGVMLAACVAVAWWLAIVPWLPLAWRIALPLGIGLACLFAMRQVGILIQPCSLHVSARGKVSLALGAQKAAPVQLLPDSTLWPHCLVLRLRDGCGRIRVVLVLPDSMIESERRALLVACRWIEARAMGLEAQGGSETQNFF